MKSSSKIIKRTNGNGKILGDPPQLPQLNGCSQSPSLICNDSSVISFPWNQLSSPDLQFAEDLQEIRGPGERDEKKRKKEKSWDEMREEIEEEAREFSRQCIQEAKARATIIIQEAYEQGFMQGKKEGEAAGRKELEPTILLMNQLMAEMEPLRRRIWEQSESNLVDLALTMTKRIVRHEIALNENVVVKVAREALESLSADDDIQIKINPEDYATLMSCKNKLFSFSEEPRNFTIETDDTIGRGGCFIESSLGQIDARIEKQLETMELALKTNHQRTAEGHDSSWSEEN